MSHHFIFVGGHLFVLRKNNLPKFRTLFIYCLKFFLELVGRQSQAFVSVIEPHFIVEHEVTMKVSKVKIMVLAASGMVCYQLIVKALRLNFV